MIVIELVKLFRRPRVWVSITLLCALPAVVAIFLATSGLAPPPGQGSAFLSAVLRDGTLFPLAALAIVLPVFLPVTVAVIAGDAVAGEAATGTLRYLLVRPVSRTRLLVAKLVALVAYVLLAVVVVAAVSLVVGVLAFGVGSPAAVGGAGGITSLSGNPLSTGELVLRLVGAIAYVAISTLSVGAVALFLSTLTDSALAAAMGALATLVVSQVLVTLGAADSVQAYLPTRHWLAWIDLFREPIFWRDIQAGLAVQAGYVVVLLLAAWANFSTRDVTS